MKLIQAMKSIKDLQRKVDDLRGKVGVYCAHLSVETPTYPDQKRQVSDWIQSCEDTLKEILRLRISIQKTNLATQVTMQLGEVQVTKTIAEWIHRRRDLSGQAEAIWKAVGDRSLKEGVYKDSQNEQRECKIVRCYDPAERDRKIAEYRSEPSVIDSTLEVVNAVTDLIEA